MQEPEYITVPVTADYNSANQIGELRVDKRYLPKGAGYLFAVGGVCKDSHMEWNMKLGRHIRVITDFDLMEVTLLPESRYDWQNVEFDNFSAVPQLPTGETK
jgi:hypothetical protein